MVAEMQTNSKPYLAYKENSNKYTVNRFKKSPIRISNKIKIIKNNQHQSNKIPVQRNFSNSKIILMFDNDMNILNRYKLFNSYSKVYILRNGIINNGFELNEKISQFKLSLIENINNLVPNSEVIKSKDIEIFLCDHSCIDVIYPGVGHNLDLINKYANQNQVIINYIYREEDLKYWNHANSRFYKFKTSFHKN